MYIDVGGETTLLVWPADRVTWDGEHRTITYANYDGSVVTVADGDAVVLGGGGDSVAESGIAGGAWAAGTTWVVPPSPACSLDSHFSVGGVGLGGA